MHAICTWRMIPFVSQMSAMGQPTKLTQRFILKDHSLSWVNVRVNTNPNLNPKLNPNRKFTASSGNHSPVYLHVFAVRYTELHKS